MLVHKVVFFCWLVGTSFGAESTTATESSSNQPSPSVSTVAESTTEPPASPTTQTPENTQPTSEPSGSTAPTDPSVPESTTVATEPPTSPTTQTPENTQPTSEPSGSTAPTDPSVPESTTVATEPPTSPTTQTPENTQPTSEPSGSTAPTDQTSSSAPSTEPSATPTTTGNETPGSSSPGPSFTPTTISSETGTTADQTTEVTVSTGPEVTSITPNETTTSEPNSTTAAVPTTAKPSACSSSPCPFDSTCIELSDGFTCQCFPGSFFSEAGCRKAKVFPGNLSLAATFEVGMSDTTTQIFLETANRIKAALRTALGDDPNYIESNVLRLSKGSIIASVDNVYKIASDTTQESFESALKNFTTGCGDACGILDGSNFTAVKLCDQKPAPCDPETADCREAEGTVNCVCNSGLIRSNFSDRSCLACPSGQKAENDKCVPCPFGYSGFNCNDSSLLAVVVISCVLGGTLLIVVLAFIIYGCRRKTKDYSSPYPSAQETRTTWSNSNIPKIPRASANVNSQFDQSHLEMTESGSTRALVAKERQGNGVMGPYDDLRTFTGNNQSRYSYLVQGRDNPLFISDDGRGTK